MSFRTLKLPGMSVSEVRREQDQVIVVFTEADIIKTMEGAKQHTHWRQSGEIILDKTSYDEITEGGAKTVSGGQLTDNVYVYQDMIRLPLHSFGDIELALEFAGGSPPFTAQCEEIQVNLYGTPQYMGHVDD